ncbi:MAG: precorrin-3B C(17)-methyltransferase [Stappiaceae bacterium]
MDARPAILILTQSTKHLADRLCAELDSELHGYEPRCADPDVGFSETISHLQSLFSSGRPIVGFCAAGILIRALAPLLSDKRQEPPVLAVSEDGKSVVPLLGGHHGANKLAVKIASCLGGHASVTTAGDTVLGVALDEPPEGWTLANPDDAKSMTAKLLAGETVALSGPLDWLREISIATDPQSKLTIIASEHVIPGSPDKLVYHPKTLALGIGCARNCPIDELKALVFKTLENQGLAIASIGCLVSLDLKADECAINELAAELGVPFRVFAAERLENETPRLKNPSDTVFAEVGCHGVSEAAALAAVGSTGRLVVEKQKSGQATCAVAKASAPIAVSNVGRARGRLSVVGIGPGADDWRTPEATGLLREAEEVVGYSLYLDIVNQHIDGKTRHDFPLGKEEDRVRFALERAAQGCNVALVSSGDAGIYAMGALVFELLDRSPEDHGVSDAAHRIEIINAPGISAFQAASAKIGAPFGHDFCTISLSDLLTPWETIEQRLEAAAAGDFVVAFYNPVSMRRRTQLARAKDILLRHRPTDTPVVLATNLGREGEHVRMCPLSDLSVDDVDMLTVVLVGASTSRVVARSDGSSWVYTPRGYEKKLKEAAE